MAFDEKLASRMRELLDEAGENTVERKMFGGLCFMVRGHMCAGIVGSDLMLRVGPDQYESLLAKAHARPMDFTGRPLTGMIYVAPAGFKTKVSLRKWIRCALDFVVALPPKKPAKKRKKSAKTPARSPRKGVLLRQSRR